MGFGHGNDGGVMAVKRRFIVRVKKDTSLQEAAELAAMHWMTCALTSEPLAEPVSGSDTDTTRSARIFLMQVVADKLGNLINKESLLSAMLDSNLPPQLAHISSLKKVCGNVPTRSFVSKRDHVQDVTTLKLKWNPKYLAASATSSEAAAEGASTDVASFRASTLRSAFACGLSGTEANGHAEFVFLPCGHVFAKKALQETVKVIRVSTPLASLGPASATTSSCTFNCPNCSKPCSSDNVLPIAPPVEVQEVLLQAHEAHVKAAKARRALKRSREAGADAPPAAAAPAGAAAAAAAAGGGSSVATPAAAVATSKKARTGGVAAPTARIQMPAAASRIVEAARAKVTANTQASGTLGKLLHEGHKGKGHTLQTSTQRNQGFLGSGSSIYSVARDFQ